MAHIDETTGLVLDGLDDLTEKARVQVRVTLPEADLSPGSDYDLLARLFGADAYQHQQPIGYTAQQIFPDSADTPYLERHGEVRRIPRRQATAASGLALLTGTAGSTQGSGSALTSAAGIAITTTAAATVFTPAWAATTVIRGYLGTEPDTVVLASTTGMAIGDPLVIGGVTYVIRDLPGGGAVIVYGYFPSTVAAAMPATPGTGAAVPLRATEAGAAGNLLTGSSLTLGSAAAGVNATATVLILSGGQDRATNKEYATEMMFLDAEYPAGDNRSAVLMWSKGYDLRGESLVVLGISDAFIYPTQRGPGTTDSIPRGVARARHLSSAKRTELQTYLYPAAPSLAHPGMVGPGNDLLVRDFVDRLVRVYVEVTPATGYGPDWIGSLTVDVGGSTSRVNTTAVPSALAVGARVVIQTGPDPANLEVRTVATVDGTGFTVSDAFTFAPVPGRRIDPGGPLSAPVVEAVAALFDKLTPGDTSPPSRYPPVSVDAPADLPRGLILGAVFGVKGVRNVGLPLPAADVTVLYPNQIVLQELIVRYV